MYEVAALICGLLFGLGLAMSGMTDINKVVGFLDITGQFDPTLIFVMGGGLLVSLPFFQFGIKRLNKPFFAGGFNLPTRKDIDTRLVTGAVLFGVGWGLVGLCPGPALASLAYGNPDVLYFVVAMLAGIFTARFIESSVESMKASNAAVKSSV